MKKHLRIRSLGRDLRKLARGYIQGAFQQSASQAPDARLLRLGTREYRIPISASSILNMNPSFEPWLDPVLRAHFESHPGLFIDVGVNRGQTLAKVLRIAPSRPYLGFEPQPSCAFFVDLFIRENRLTHCTLVPAGLSDGNAVVSLYLRYAADGDGTATIVSDYRPDEFYGARQAVPVFRGDQALADLGVEDACTIKIDVEGAELEVLEGLRGWFERARPFALFEVLNNYLVAQDRPLPSELIPARKQRASAISKFFRDRGFRVLNIRGHTRLVETPEIVPTESPDLSCTNFTAIPSERLDAFVRAYSGAIEFTG